MTHASAGNLAARVKEAARGVAHLLRAETLGRPAFVSGLVHAPPLTAAPREDAGTRRRRRRRRMVRPTRCADCAADHDRESAAASGAARSRRPHAPSSVHEEFSVGACSLPRIPFAALSPGGSTVDADSKAGTAAQARGGVRHRWGARSAARSVSMMSELMSLRGVSGAGVHVAVLRRHPCSSCEVNGARAACGPQWATSPTRWTRSRS